MSATTDCFDETYANQTAECGTAYTATIGATANVAVLIHGNISITEQVAGGTGDAGVTVITCLQSALSAAPARFTNLVLLSRTMQVQGVDTRNSAIYTITCQDISTIA